MSMFEKPFESTSNGGSRETLRKHLVAALAEFVGTFLFLYFAFAGHTMAVQQASDQGRNGTNSAQTVIFISMSYGFSLLVTAWSLYRISGGLFNPAVTLGLCISGNLPWIRAAFLFPAQMLGGMVAAALVSCMIPGPIAVVNTTLAPGMSIAQGAFFEMFLTCELVLAVLILAAEKSKDTYIAPVGIGLALFVAEIAGVYYTGGSLNPARSFGPCVASRTFPGYHWIYWVGPAMGALLAAGFYMLVKYLNNNDIEDANPGQDSAAGDYVRD
ncbi:putative aquaporin-3 [Elasticomyces elasticus]|nr:putative aquaporin-3 [Elasticomyces elasticus]